MIQFNQNNKEILRITVYEDNRVELIKNDEVIKCTNIAFEAGVGEVPTLTITQNVYGEPNKTNIRSN